jgi:hypothetical protein
MRPPRTLQDDRLYRMEIKQWNWSEERPWTVVTLHNLFATLPARQDEFATHAEALRYYLKVVVETPRASLGGLSPDPLPSIGQYTAWLKLEKLHDPVLNPITDKTK